MTDPLETLAPRFRAAIAEALGQTHAQVDPALRRSDRADYQANAALALQKSLRRPPRELAAKIVDKLDLAGIADSVEVAGAGFINVTLSAGFLSNALGRVAESERLGVDLAPDPEVVALDYSSPNIAKEMHVGHLRSTILGDALARVLEAVGHRVVRQNHLGDWGTPFGMLLERLVDSGAAGEDVSVGDLNAFYVEARHHFDSDPEFADRARRRVVLLQSGDPVTLELWRRFVTESRRYLETMYATLGVTLRDSDVAGESLYNPMLEAVVRDLGKLGLLRESEGAQCVFPDGFSGRDGDPLPLIVRKQDGGFGYAATDLAAIRHRTGTLGARRLVYVVGSTQSQHFAMVFAVAQQAGFLVSPTRAEHVAFGSVLGEDHKILKTRDGKTIRLTALLDEAIERAHRAIAQKNPDLAETTATDVARVIGVGALKYADLSNDRIKDYVFDYDRMLSFDGNTAPYLQYAHARIQSIVRRSQVDTSSLGAITVALPPERALALEILGFGSVVHEVAVTLEPHRLCTYLFTLATAFSTFYEQCPVLKAASDEERDSRLALSALTGRVLARGLDLLGIGAPDRM
jgi:arginyl-tRNA synthetase